ncbi:MAG: P-type conjugative transfer protein TrbG [Sphingobium sp.]|jgi:type IV secretion system protein VirB9|nr:P-type conjugative transfer protein TrbG [Sphingobium sp.]OHC90772.1 MAG: P-type conjugative transfer protein TrbG [Sphingomonadales bacterium GWF1_63_6]|tara:strand:- start:7104 stop:8105 length:1002 start_codon:yes stop_codon:yes gene_type:complete
MMHVHRSGAAIAALLISVYTTTACAATRPALHGATQTPAVRIAEPEKQVEIVTVAKPLPLPGQLKPVPPIGPGPVLADPKTRIVAANAAARMEPARDAFINAMQQYPWAEGALYQVYTAPGQVTDIALQPGEMLVGAGPVAAGDTVRWIIGDTLSGAGETQRVHILAKPTRPDLLTNLVINTDRRTYHLELRATPATYMASVSWSYPQDELIALRQRNAAIAAKAPIAAGINIASLDFGYAIDGDKPSWRPLRAFDDGSQVFIEFPASVAQGEMPPVFILGSGGNAELVNYRVQDRFIIIDRLFSAAELRMGDKKTAQRVRLTRIASGRRTRP